MHVTQLVPGALCSCVCGSASNAVHCIDCLGLVCDEQSCIDMAPQGKALPCTT